MSKLRKGKMTAKVNGTNIEDRISFNQGSLEIIVFRKFGVFEKAWIWDMGEKPPVTLTEEQLFFVYESLKDYFEKTKKEK